MDLLPEMRSEDLNQRNFQSWDLTVHEDASQIELNLETDVDVGAVDCRRPPKCKPSIWNLVQTRALSVSEFFVLH